MADAGSNTIQHRLLQGPAVGSLQFEREVLDVVRRLGWTARQSAYYQDPREQKIREIDVMASASWQRTLSTECQIAELHVPIECKSLKEYHICVMTDNSQLPAMSACEWFGVQADGGVELLERLSKLGLTLRQIELVLRRFRSFAYPEEAWRVRELTPPPPPVRWEASAFRETNVGSERDLDSSVVWKAGLSLEAAALSRRNVRLDAGFEMLEIAADTARREDKKIEEEILYALGWSSLIVEILHPVLVVESHLWRVAPGGLKKIEWFRLVRSVPGSGARSFWFDIVCRKAAPSYFRKLVQYYNSEFQRPRVSKCKRPTIQWLESESDKVAMMARPQGGGSQ